MMVSGPSISTSCSLQHWMSETTSFEDNKKCYLCCRTLLLPISPAVQKETRYYQCVIAAPITPNKTANPMMNPGLVASRPV